MVIIVTATVGIMVTATSLVIVATTMVGIIVIATTVITAIAMVVIMVIDKKTGRSVFGPDAI